MLRESWQIGQVGAGWVMDQAGHVQTRQGAGLLEEEEEARVAVYYLDTECIIGIESG